MDRIIGIPGTYPARTHLGIALGALALIVSGCAGSRAVQQPPATTAAPEVQPAAPPLAVWATTDRAATTDTAIRDEVQDWLGTPHRMGGTTRDGVDCSAFVQAIYRDVFHIELPRTTTEQARTGTEISPDELRPGDLVFFHPAKSNHVGIYLSDGEFAHASESHGVTISKFDQPYWTRSYWTARRILQDDPATGAEVLEPQPAPVAAATHPSPHSDEPVPLSDDTSARAGW